jgi:hypothetical protein
MINTIIVTGIVFFQLWLAGNNYTKLAWSLVIPQLLIGAATVLTFYPKAGKGYMIPGNLMKVSMFTGLISMVFVYIR